MSGRPEQVGAASPGTRELPGELHSALLYTRQRPYRAESMTGSKKAEMAVQRTKANAKQHKSNVLKASFQAEDQGSGRKA